MFFAACRGRLYWLEGTFREHIPGKMISKLIRVPDCEATEAAGTYSDRTGHVKMNKMEGKTAR